MHLMLAVNITKSGFQVGMWVERMLRILMNEGKREGPAICDEDGYLLKSAQINLEFRQQLAIVQNFRSDLIKETINVFDIYNIRQSLRRGSTSIAMREKLPQPVIDLVNQWSSRGMSKEVVSQIVHHGKIS